MNNYKSIIKMKKILPLLILPFLYFQCTNNNTVEDDMNAEEEISLFSITTSNNFFSESELNSGTPKIFATGENGEVITEDIMDNGGTAELSAEYDIMNYQYDVTLFKKRVNTNNLPTNYIFKTFIGVYPFHYEILNIENPNPDGEKVEVSIVNPDGILSEFIGFGSGSMSNNNGIYTCKSTLKGIPDNFYLSFKKNSENFKRYIWLEGVTGDTKDTIQFIDTEIIDTPISISYPNNESILSVIEGINLLNPNRRHTLSNQTINNGTTEISYYVPIELFDLYRVLTSIINGDDRYSTLKKSNTINPNYNYPNLELEVLSNSYDQFQMTSSSDFDYYEALFTYESEDDGYSVYWTIYGKKGQQIEYKLPNLYSQISDDFSNFNPNNLTLNRVSLRKFQGINLYDEFIYDILDVDFESNESITSHEVYTKTF
jgi:hypothetical protein